MIMTYETSEFNFVRDWCKVAYKFISVAEMQRNTVLTCSRIRFPNGRLPAARFIIISMQRSAMPVTQVCYISFINAYEPGTLRLITRKSHVQPYAEKFNEILFANLSSARLTTGYRFNVYVVDVSALTKRYCQCKLLSTRARYVYTW